MTRTIIQFAPAERRTAEHLAEKGPAVVSVSEGYGIYGRTAFRYEEGSDPYIRVGPVAVYAGGHEFDDDIAWPDGSDVPLRSMYPAMIEIRDTGGDQSRTMISVRRRRFSPGDSGLFAVKGPADDISYIQCVLIRSSAKSARP